MAVRKKAPKDAEVNLNRLYAFKYSLDDHKMEVIKRLPPADYEDAYFTEEDDKIFLNYKDPNGNGEGKTRVK